MVTNMSKTKAPRSGNSPVDLDDDDDIIELTEEVIVKPKKDDRVKDLQAADADAPGVDPAPGRCRGRRVAVVQPARRLPAGTDRDDERHQLRARRRVARR